MPARSGTSLPHQVVHTALRRRRSHTLAFCRSTQTVRPPHVYIDVWFTGIFLIEPVVLECFSPAAPWSSHLYQHLQIILENSSFQQQFWLTVLFCTFIGFIQLRNHTRFRDSFCLVSVFKCLFTYLLTYLLVIFKAVGLITLLLYILNLQNLTYYTVVQKKRANFGGL